ncbi:MAG: SUMF1/EgtB/PvdO family nonheme iron enzyme [Nitrospinaceae bacterium]|nr:SUMF1/EgtB/PvdO family nonheme iron enzyme [Nitrospina sp.]MBT5867292.1 SUMF1/EgtB/PvdO family nonheme iron enzyme [Nitrospinaceae bacterium]MBT6346228.1 SUMF1/EgtB/PvdO family nonheme iron enzyme [Nitrospina sp.]
MKSAPFSIFKISVYFIILSVFIFPSFGFSSVVDETLAGDAKYAEGKILDAEKHYSTALEMDPGNWRIMRPLAEVKFKLKKYIETKQLVDSILAMEVIKRNTVLVKLDGDTEPFQAEIIDERVLTPDSGKNNMRNYVDGEAAKPVLHYRLFSLKTGREVLTPHKVTKIKYQGVPTRVYAYVQELHAKVENELIRIAGPKGPVKMVALKGGCYQMGSEFGAKSEEPIHEACLNPFKLDIYEVKQRDFQAVMGHNPSRFKGADLPVEMVTWHEAEDYCKKSNKRLPTESEWEFAVRGGTSTEYHWGSEFDASKSNFCDSSCSRNLRSKEFADGFPETAPVGSFPANPYGLYDMTGNVNEWVSDWFEERAYSNNKKDNPKGPVRTNLADRRGGGTQKVYRGGAWQTDANSLRSAWRKGFEGDYRLDGTGFRCAM